MFEEVCLVCGKHLLDDRRAYCSDDCQGVDKTSPSISSASSAFSSPHIEYAVGGEVPALVPSALGSALTNYRYSSSSASSTSWSVLTDDEDDVAVLGSDNGYASDANSTCEGGSGVPGLNYARRPSGTNNRSTIPLLHRRASSGSSCTRAKEVRRSVPSIQSFEYASNDDDDATSRDHTQNIIQGPSSWAENERKATITTKTKGSRNRASLPAYFSLLQIGSSHPRSSPLSSSSGVTEARHSPPTPKLGLSDLSSRFSHPSKSPSTVEATPRGRRREPGTSRSNLRSRSRSRSLSRGASHIPPRLLGRLRGRLDSKSSVEQVFDWSSSLTRGHPPIRRNSSPPPRMILPTEGMEDYFSMAPRSRRGRRMTNELDGEGFTARAPGLGNGRSGLRDRQRDGASRGFIGL